MAGSENGSSIGPAVISAIGNTIGAGMSVLGGHFSSRSSALKSFQYSKLLQEHSARTSYKYTRMLNQHAYQDTTQSMREAGINPMLAITNGVNGLSVNAGSASVPVTAPQMDLSDLGSSAVQAYQSYKQLKNDTKRVENETNVADSTVKKQDYESDLAHEQSALINEQNRQLKEFGPQQQQLNLINTAKQGALLDKQMQDLDNQMSNRSLNTASSVLLNRATSASAKQSAIQQKRDNEWFKKHPNWYNFSQGASAVGNVFRGGLSGSVGLKK